MIRTFISVNLPPEIKEKIGEVVKDFDIKGIKVVDPELVHVTLKFLGPVEESRIGGIEATLGKVKAMPFEARFRSIGGFPGSRNPRVIWIGAEGNFDGLSRQVEDAMEGIGFERECRFQPHVTIGRVKFPSPEQKQKLPKLFEKYKDYYAGSMIVSKIYLMKSALSRRGPTYEVLKEISI